MSNLDKVLSYYGWERECESPFEIRHTETGSFASGEAADIVCKNLLFSYNKDFYEFIKFYKDNTSPGHAIAKMAIEEFADTEVDRKKTLEELNITIEILQELSYFLRKKMRENNVTV